ncbi:cell division protein FtsA [Desulfovibrio sp. OttesenSCG-928-C14]|nr:cell division protein FtsA [Desulfovibrio sp. OttesenSCG-928-C14]
MAKNELVVGLDVGTTKICAVVGEPTPDGVDIVGIGSCPSTGLRKGVVVSIDNTVNSIQKALQEAELMAGCEIRSVYAGIAGSHIKGFNSHGVIAIKNDVVTEKDVERAMDAAKAVAIPLDREVIHTLAQEYIIDDQRSISDPIGMAGVRLEVRVHIVTGAVASAQNIVRCCHRSGLDVADIVLESLASAKAVLTDEERELGVVLVDLGGGTSDIAIYANDAIKHTAVLPLGGQNLTNDIAYGLRTPLAGAEEIKIKHGCAMVDLVHHDDIVEVPGVGGREPRALSRRMLAEICQPRMEEILALVDQELLRSGYKHLAGAGVVLTGGTSLIDGCQELAEQIFNMPTRVGYPRNIGGLKDVVNSPMYATAVGLLCYGTEKIGVPDTRLVEKEGSMFKRILDKMKNWFTDVS